METSSLTEDGLASIPAVFERNARECADSPAYREKEFGIWQSWSWAQAWEEVEALALGLVKLGLKEGEFVAVAGRNRPHFYWTMVAVQSAGAVPVPVYQDSAAEEMAYVLDHCGAAFAVVEDQEQVDKIAGVRDRVGGLRHVVYVDPRGLRKYPPEGLHSFADVQRDGRAARGELGGELERRRGALGGDSMCVMLYTSGTTGRPKGVVLDNAAIIGAAKSAVEFDRLGRREEVLAYLPMAWVGDFVFSIGQACWCGFCVNCPESPETTHTDIREIGPTYYFAPPRIFENQLTGVMIRMADAGALKRWMFKAFMNHARRVGGAILDGRPTSLLDRILYRIGDVLVYGPLKDTLGLGRVRVGYTAGEAIGPELFGFFRSIGINLKQLYGQTEAAALVTLQPDGEVRDDTVGVPAPGVEIRISEQGEVLYRSPGAFSEYYRNPESTAATRDAEGWIATGDAGFLEPDSGHLRIIDRAKDVGKMADGRMFAPKYVENKLKFFPDILEAVVFGGDRDSCAAFVNIDLDAVGSWAERNNVGYASYQELAGHPLVLELIAGHVGEMNRSLAEDPMMAHCQIGRFLVLHKELDADDGEVTRTRKVRRGVVGEKYADLVTALYDGSDKVEARTEVVYEDGRRGEIAATLQVREARTYPTAAQARAA